MMASARVISVRFIEYQKHLKKESGKLADMTYRTNEKKESKTGRM